MSLILSESISKVFKTEFMIKDINMFCTTDLYTVKNVASAYSHVFGTARIL